MRDNLSELETVILALQQTTSLPDSLVGTVEPNNNSASKINWDSNGWLVNLGDVLPWIGQTGDLEEDPETALRLIFKSFGSKAPTSMYSSNDGCWQLTQEAIPVLISALEEGLRLKESYELNIEEGESQVEASAIWNEDVSNLDFSKGETEVIRINADSQLWPINDFASRAVQRKLNLNPSYQRDVVWKEGESQQLIESILRGIPLPSVILNLNDEKVFDIVDGKQRLTAILRFCGKHPKGLDVKDRLSTERKVDPELFDSDYREWLRQIQKGKPNLTKDEKKYLPFTFATSKKQRWSKDCLTQFNKKYYSELRDRDVNVAGDDIAVSDVFEMAGNYKIPVIEYRNTPVEAIHNVFSIYNKTGQKLNPEELRNATYHHLKLMHMVLDLSDINNAFGQDYDPWFDEGKKQIITLMTECHINNKRYAWTKLISLVLAHLTTPPPVDEDGDVSTKGTAAFINEMFDTARDNEKHLLNRTNRLKQVSKYLFEGVRIFQRLKPEFSKKFINDASGSPKWEDFNFVSVWLACCLVGVAGVTASDIDDSKLEAISELSDDPDYSFRDKTQTRYQWSYIGWVVRGIVGKLSNETAVSEAQIALLKCDSLAAYATLEQPHQKNKN